MRASLKVGAEHIAQVGCSQGYQAIANLLKGLAAAAARGARWKGLPATGWLKHLLLRHLRSSVAEAVLHCSTWVPTDIEVFGLLTSAAPHHCAKHVQRLWYTINDRVTPPDDA